MAFSGHATTQSPQALQASASGVNAVFRPCRLSFNRISSGIDLNVSSGSLPISKTS